MKKDEILKAFHFRHATKKFDASRKISDEDFQFILETARLSPSSFGFEAWKFLIIQNSELREKIKEVSWGAQGQLPTASHFIIILARRDLRYDSPFIEEQMINVKKMPDEIFQHFKERTKSFQESDLPMLDNDRAMLDWASKQTYIALGNMMTSAALIGIDSCPIEGFDYQGVNNILEKEGLLENGQWSASVMAAFGYREADPERPKTRKQLDKIVKWVN